MSHAKHGDTVRVHYTGTLSDGTVFDSSRDGEPLEFTLGTNQVIVGFEQAILGNSVGDAKVVTINASDAYGDYRDEMIIKMAKTQFPPDADPAVGQRLQLQDDQGNVAIATVIAVDEETATLDANHPLAGKDLTFDIELMEIVVA